MKNESLRQHVLYLLKGDGAHADFEATVKDLPAKLRGEKPDGAEHSPWEVLEHLRIAQWDVLKAIEDAKHVSPGFPAGYWPTAAEPKNAKDWDASVQAFQKDFDALVKLVSSDKTDLLAPLHNSDDQTVMRKIMMVADHTSYHLGEMVLLRRLMGTWSAG